jgi:preprotein translocase subunit SecG
MLGAAHAQSSSAEGPIESNTIGTIIFAVLFFGFCIGFIWLTWRSQKNDKKQQEQDKKDQHARS